MIRMVGEKDIGYICDIYNYYIGNTIITFETEPVSIEEMRKRIKAVTPVFPWYVYEQDGDVAGYAYAGRWKDRYAYRFSVESTVYVKYDTHGKGIGSQLYAVLIKELQKRNFHAILAGIALPNKRSRRLHEKFGFTKVAHFREVGYKFNKWIDVGIWELIK